MGKVEGSDVCQDDFFTVRKGDNNSVSHRGDVDVVFCITRKMTGAAVVGDGERKDKDVGKMLLQ